MDGVTLGSAMESTYSTQLLWTLIIQRHRFSSLPIVINRIITYSIPGATWLVAPTHKFTTTCDAARGASFPLGPVRLTDTIESGTKSSAIHRWTAPRPTNTPDATFHHAQRRAAS